MSVIRKLEQEVLELRAVGLDEERRTDAVEMPVTAVRHVIGAKPVKRTLAKMSGSRDAVMRMRLAGLQEQALQVYENVLGGYGGVSARDMLHAARDVLEITGVKSGKGAVIGTGSLITQDEIDAFMQRGAAEMRRLKSSVAIDIEAEHVN